MGQDTHADELLSQPADYIGIALPMVCVTEAVSAFDRKRDDRKKLKEELNRQIEQLQRRGEVEIAQNLVAQLVQADLTNAQLLNNLFYRLDYYLLKIARRAELLPISARVVDSYSLIMMATELDRDDALILASILAHGESNSRVDRAFLTGNFKDFESAPVRQMIKAAGIKQFRSTERVLRWIDRNQRKE
jgi:hypothetical protein